MKNILISTLLAIVFTFASACSCKASLTEETGIKNNALIDSILKDESETFEILLKNNAEVNQKDQNQNTALMAAAEFGNSREVELLIKKGADINAINAQGKTALILSANYGNIETARSLINAGALIDIKDKIFQMNAFLYAVKFGFLDMAKYFIEKGADINALDYKENNALAVAIRHNNVEMAKYLISLKFDANGLINRKSGETYLMYAAGHGMADMVKLLIESGADINKKTPYGFSALVHAATCGVRAVEDIIVEKSDVIFNGDGTYALGFAIISENYQMIEKLIKKGLSADSKYKIILNNPLYSGDPISMLIDKIINNGVIANENISLLIIATVTGNLTAVKKLVEGGAGVDWVESGCHTPLMAALNFEETEIAKFLIEHGANINAKSARGETPLILATYMQNNEIAKLLIKNGADINQTTKKGESAPLIALVSGNEELIKLFEEKGADIAKLINAGSQNFENPLEKAIESETIPFIKKLLKTKVSLNKTNRFGSSPLSLAVRGGNYEIVKLLIDSGADVNYRIENYSSKTALSEAIERGHEEIVKLFAQRGNSFDKQMISQIADNAQRSEPSIINEFGLKKNAFYSTKPWNLKGFPEKIRKIINEKYEFKKHADRGEIIRDTLGVSLKEDIDIKNYQGETALSSLVYDAKNNEIIKLLLNNNADINMQANGSTPLCEIIKNANREIYDYLITRKINLSIDENSLSQTIISNLNPMNNNQIESLKILLDLAKRKNYSLKGNSELTSLIFDSASNAGIKYLHDNKLLGMQNIDTQTIELCFKNENNQNHNSSIGYGKFSIKLANGFYIAKMIGLACKDTINLLEANYKKPDTNEIAAAAMYAKNFECFHYYLNALTASKRSDMPEFLSQALRSNEMIETEVLKAAFKIIQNSNFKLSQDQKDQYAQMLLPKMITARINDDVKSYLSQNDLSGNERLNYDLIHASVSSNNFAMNKFLMFYLPFSYKAKLTNILLNQNAKNERQSKTNMPEKADESKLDNLIRAGNIEEFKKVFDSTILKEKKIYIRNLFSNALEYGNEEIAKYIINQENDFYNKYYVEDALSHERIDIADYAMSRGAKIENPDLCYFTAIRDNKPAIIDYLLNKKADPNMEYLREMPLSYALKNQRIEIFKKLVEGGADLKRGRFNKHGDSFFGTSGKFDYSGMRSYQKAEDRSTLLNYAILNNLRQASLILAPREADINMVGELGKCALELAIERNYTDVALEILKRKDFDIKSINSKKALHAAIETENAMIIKALSEKGVIICENFNLETLKDIIKNGNINSTAIICAMSQKNIDCEKIFNSMISAGVSTAEIIIDAINVKNNPLLEKFITPQAAAGMRNKYGKPLLLIAVETENKEAVELLLKNGADPNTLDMLNRPLILTAAYRNQFEILRLLVEHGARINAQAANYSVDAVYASLHAPDDKILKYLINKKADMSKALIKSIENLETNFVARLLENGANPNICDSNCKNAVMLARETLQYEVEDLLLKYGADPAHYGTNFPPLKTFEIIRNNGDENYAIELVSKLGSLEEKNDAGDTFLIAALKNTNMKKLAKFLINKNADLNAYDSTKTTAFMYLLHNNLKEIDFNLILAKIKNITAVNADGKNALFFCTDQPATVIESLIKAGVNINAKSIDGCTPLANFIKLQKYDNAKLLITLGANVNIKNNAGKNSLMIFLEECKNGFVYENYVHDKYKDLFNFILKKVQNLDERDSEGNTALIISAQLKNSLFIKSLIAAGADFNIKNNSGETALIKADNKQMATALFLAGADFKFDEKTFNDQNTIKQLLSIKSCSIIKKIIDKNIDKINDFDQKLIDSFIKTKTGNEFIMLVYIAQKKKISAEKIYKMLFKDFEINDSFLVNIILEAGNRKLVEYMQNQGFKLEFPKNSSKNSSILMNIAINAGNDEIVSMLLEEKKYDSEKKLVENAKNAFSQAENSIARKILSHIGTLENELISDIIKGFVRNSDTEEIKSIALVLPLQKRGSLLTDAFWQFMNQKNYETAISLIKNNQEIDLYTKDSEGFPLFIHCGKIGNVELADFLIQKGVNINQKGPFGRTALYYACIMGDMRMIKFLEKNGADLNIKNDKNSNAILAAATSGSVEAIEFFIKKGQSINYKNKFGLTPLIAALITSHYELAEFLISKGADLNAYYSEEGQEQGNALKFAVNANNLKIVKLIFEKGFIIDPKSKIAREITAIAIRKKNNDLINILSDKLKITFNNFQKNNAKQSVNAIKPSNSFNFHDAISEGSIDKVKLLIYSGADVNCTVENNITPLMLALKTRNLDIAKLLIENGSNANTTDSQGANAADYLLMAMNYEASEEFFKRAASLHLHVEPSNRVLFDCPDTASMFIEKLVMLGIKLEYKDHLGRTPLSHSIFSNKLNMALELIRLGANIKSKDNNGLNPLMHLCRIKGARHQDSVMKKVANNLIERTSTINEQDLHGNTALHHAAITGNDELMALLIDRGAEVNIKNNSAETPFLLYISQHDNPYIALKMIKAGARLVSKDGPAFSKDSITAITKVNNAKITKIVIDDYINRNGEINDEIIRSLSKAESNAGIPAALYIVEKKMIDPAIAFKKYFSSIDLSDKNIIMAFIEYGNHEYLNFFKSKGLDLQFPIFHDFKLIIAIRSDNNDALDIILEKTPSFNPNVINEAVEISILENNTKALKSLLNLSCSTEIILTDRCIEKLVNDLDTENIFLLSKIKNSNEKKEEYFDKVLEKIIEYDETTTDFFVKIFEKKLLISHSKPDEAANSYLPKAFQAKKYDIIYHLESLIKGKLTKYNSNSLVLSAASNNLEMVKTLVKCGAYPDSKDEYGYYAIQRAIDRNNIKMVKLFVECGIDMKSQCGINAMSSAIAAGSMEIISYLIKMGADVNAVSLNGQSHLLFSILFNSPKITELLINNGAYFNKNSIQGKALFQAAISSQNADTIKLIEKGPSQMALKKMEPVIKMIEHIKSGNIKGVEELIKKGINLNTKDDCAKTPLIYAVEYDNAEIVSFLLASGANPNDIDVCECQSVLITAIKHVNCEIIKKIIEKGADLNVKDRNGFDALMHSINYNNDISCYYILQAAFQNNNFKISPDHLKKANEYGNTEIIELLTQYSSSNEICLTKEFKEKRLLAAKLTKAFMANDSTAVSIILNNAQSINQDKIASLLTKAIYKNSPEMVKLLSNKLYEPGKIKDSILSLTLGGTKEIEILNNTIQAFPDNLIEGIIKDLIISFITSQNTSNLKILLEKHAGRIKENDMPDIFSQAAAVNDKDIIKLLQKHIGSFKNPFCAYMFYNALQKSDNEIINLFLNSKFDIDKCEIVEQQKILRGIGRFGTPDLIVKLSKKINIQNYGDIIFDEASLTERTDNMQKLIDTGFCLNTPNLGYLLTTALDNKKYRSAKCLINCGISADRRDTSGLTALMHAALTNEIELAQAALAHGANIALTDESGDTAIIIAKKHASHSIISLIENFKNAKNETVNDVYYLLGLFKNPENDDKIIKIITNDYNVNESTLSGTTLLQKAIEHKRPKILKTLLDSGANIQPAPRNEMTPIKYSIIQANEEILTLIALHFKNINAIINCGETFLTTAVNCASKESVLILLKLNADPNTADAKGKTPLQLARETKDYEMINYFEDTGIVNILNNIDSRLKMKMSSKNTLSSEVELENFDASASIIDAVAMNQPLRVKYLLLKGAKIKSGIKEQPTAFQYAFKNQNQELINLINLYECFQNNSTKEIEFGTNCVSFKSSSSVSLVYQPKTSQDYLNLELRTEISQPQTFGNGKINKIKELIRKGANVNYAHPDNNQPLIIAILQQDLEVARLLIENGANVNLSDKSFGTAFNLACEYGNIDMVKLLIQYGQNVKGIEGRNAFTNASYLGNIEMVKFLISQGVDINSKDVFDRSALMMSLSSNNNNMIKFLIKNGANINEKLSEDENILTFAIGGHKFGAVQKLIENGANVHWDGLTKWSPLKKLYCIMKSTDKSDDGNKLFELIIDKSQNIGTDPVILDAIFHGDMALIEKLVAKGAEINSLIDQKVTPLIYSIKLDKKNIFDYLLSDKSVDLNKTDCEGKTPLIWAADYAREDYVKILIEKGADTSIKDRFGTDALFYAKNSGSEKIVEMITKKSMFNK